MFWNFNYLPSFALCLSEILNRGSPKQHARSGRGALASAAQAFPFSRGLRSPLTSSLCPPTPHSAPLYSRLGPTTPRIGSDYIRSVFRNGFSVYGVRSQGMIQSFSVLLQALFVNNNLFAAFTRLKGTSLVALSSCLPSPVFFLANLHPFSAPSSSYGS